MRSVRYSLSDVSVLAYFTIFNIFSQLATSIVSKGGCSWGYVAAAGGGRLHQGRLWQGGCSTGGLQQGGGAAAGGGFSRRECSTEGCGQG